MVDALNADKVAEKDQNFRITPSCLTLLPRRWHIYIVDLEPRVGMARRKSKRASSIESKMGNCGIAERAQEISITPHAECCDSIASSYCH
jgi:hypothetical protein